MIEFPEKTFFNKVIPKVKFYEKLTVSSAIKDYFVKGIDSIIWRNKLTNDTLNIQIGDRVKEIEVIEIVLKQNTLNYDVLKLIDKGIPYHLLFLLRFEDKYMACMGYKELDNLTIKEYFKSEWLSFEELPVKIAGFTLDEVYDNFVKQINKKLDIANVGVKDAIEKVSDMEKLDKKISQLQNKIRKEVQFNKQIELKKELKELLRTRENF